MDSVLFRVETSVGVLEKKLKKYKGPQVLPATQLYEKMAELMDILNSGMDVCDQMMAIPWPRKAKK